jgi:hypothetical protein
MVAHICNPSYSGGGGRRIMIPRLALGKSMRPYLKTKATRAGDMA